MTTEKQTEPRRVDRFADERRVVRDARGHADECLACRTAYALPPDAFLSSGFAACCTVGQRLARAALAVWGVKVPRGEPLE